jgi:glutathione S-transferase
MGAHRVSEDRECWWWLSFCDDVQFLGVAIVKAPDIREALLAARRAGCNPGGEVLARHIPEDKLPAPWLRHKLLSMADLDAAGLRWTTPRAVGLPTREEA